jgi:hypothetical protein
MPQDQKFKVGRFGDDSGQDDSGRKNPRNTGRLNRRLRLMTPSNFVLNLLP